MKSPGQRYALRRGSREIAYEVRRSSRARSRITVNVHPDCRVVVTAPRWTSLASIHEVVAGYAGWIERRLDQFLAAGPPYRPEYRSGAEHFFLGESYLLELVPSRGRRGSAALRGRRLRVEAPNGTPEAVRRLLRRWYRAQADRCFGERLERLVAGLPWVDRLPPWSLRRMRSQWGSCSKRGELSLNTYLIKAAPSQVDYVLLHELCHLRYHDHGKGFRQLMDRHMPDWRERRRELNAAAHKLLLD